MPGGIIELIGAIANLSSILNIKEILTTSSSTPAWDVTLIILTISIIGIAIIVMTITGIWGMLNKAKLPRWGILIPGYNIHLLFKLAGRSRGWTRRILFPPVLIILLLTLNFDIAKRFGKGFGFGLGLLFLHLFFAIILGCRFGYFSIMILRAVWGGISFLYLVFAIILGFSPVLLFLDPIFAMILGFGDAKYHPVEENSEVIEA